MEQDAVKDFLSFKKMITPSVIQIIFWLGVGFCVLGGLYTMFAADFLSGLVTLLVGPIVIRIYCEIMIIFFRMNQSLHEMNMKMGASNKKGGDSVLDM